MPVSDDEIKGFMDFGRVLLDSNKHAVLQKTTLGKWIKLFAVVAVVLLGTTVVMMDLPQERKSERAIPTASNRQRTDTIAAKVHITDENAATVEEAVVSKRQLSKRRRSKSEGPEKKSVSPTQPDDANNKAVADSAVVYQYRQAEPIAGYADLYAYFDRTLTYPPQALKDSLEGVVIATFTINPHGKPEQVRIENSLGKLFDDEVNRVILNMPQWNPAYYKGKPISSRLSIPLTFQIKNRTK